MNFVLLRNKLGWKERNFWQWVSVKIPTRQMQGIWKPIHTKSGALHCLLSMTMNFCSNISSAEMHLLSFVLRIWWVIDDSSCATFLHDWKLIGPPNTWTEPCAGLMYGWDGAGNDFSERSTLIMDSFWNQRRNELNKVRQITVNYIPPIDE